MEEGTFTPTTEGAPQGGVLSPLLANVALHGMEAMLVRAFKAKEGIPTLVRYADDLVVLHPTKAGVEKARHLLEDWLKEVGLELKPSKTRLTHTLEGAAGFDFLGFHVRQYPVGRTHSGKDVHGNPLGFKTLIMPSKEAVEGHLADLGRIVHEHQAAAQVALIEALNPVIQGWTNYHRTQVAKHTFSTCDSRLYSMLSHWAQFRHPNKRRNWITGKYWGINRGEGWQFMTQEGSVLKQHKSTSIRRHVKVKGAASPYDGNLLYWAQRLKDHPLTNSRTGYLLRLQHGRCALCGLFFKDGELLETDHIIPRHLGGDDRLMNLQLLHRHCHDQKTAKLDAVMAQAMNQGINDNDSLTEEPCEAKVSRTVLERGRGK
jgi:RNA-directed DNA polymerase